MVIELFGLPGSGKSTLAAILRTEQVACKIEINTLFERFWYVLLFTICHPLKLLFWAGILFTNSPTGLFRYKAHLVSVTIAQTQKARWRSWRGYRVIVDEGLCQRLLSLYEKPLSVGQLRRAVRQMILPDRLIIITGGDFGRFVTSDDRDNSPRCRLGAAYLAAWRAVMATNFSLTRSFISDVANRREDLLIITVDNSTRADLSLAIATFRDRLFETS